MANKKGKKGQENKSTAAGRVAGATGKGYVKGLLRKPKPGETRGSNAERGAVQGGKNQARNELPAPVRVFVRKPKTQAQTPKPPKRRRIF